MSLHIYGKLPKGERLKKIKASPNYLKGSFQNLSLTNAMAEDASFFKLMRDFMNKPAHVKPSKKIPFIKTDLSNIKSENPSLVWFGHSSYLLKINDLSILVDPVLSGNAAPLSFMVKAFDGSDAYKPEDFPTIDILLLTHDHYDHLDYKTVVKLKHKIKKVICSLGVGSHLEHWGFNKRIIHEMDWWESREEDGLNFTAVPGRHFSGRGIKRGQSLWSGFVLKSSTHNLFLGGDSGYDTHFKTIGEKFGPFDLALLECGQYNVMWPHIHMMPEETVQAAIDLNAKVLMPVHWGKFTLALHPWDEPIERVLIKAAQLSVNVNSPKIGELVEIGGNLHTEKWWKM